MNYIDRTIEFKVFGKYALFTEPMTKTGGEKYSMMIPSYEALKGICDNIYWKPSFRWVIDEVRVMNEIQMESKGFIPKTIYQDGNTLSYYTYLKDVEYRVRAHFEFNVDRVDLKEDFNVKKHLSIAKRSVKNGGRFGIFLGNRECMGYVEPCDFLDGDGFYDNKYLNFGLSYHGLNYPLENSDIDYLETRFDILKMENGIVKFNRPENCLHVIKTNGNLERK